MVNFNEVLRKENIEWFKETGRNEEEETDTFRHFEIYGPTYDKNGEFIVYKDLETSYQL
jgi:hypothetical protein